MLNYCSQIMRGASELFSRRLHQLSVSQWDSEEWSEVAWEYWDRPQLFQGTPLTKATRGTAQGGCFWVDSDRWPVSRWTPGSSSTWSTPWRCRGTRPGWPRSASSCWWLVKCWALTHPLQVLPLFMGQVAIIDFFQFVLLQPAFMHPRREGGYSPNGVWNDYGCNSGDFVVQDRDDLDAKNFISPPFNTYKDHRDTQV